MRVVGKFVDHFFVCGYVHVCVCVCVGTNAKPVFTLSFYTEFEKSKELVLVRGEIISPALVKAV